MFKVGNLDRGAAELLPGLVDQPLQLPLVVLLQAAHGLVPEGDLDLVAQLAQLLEARRVNRQRIPQADPQSGAKREVEPADAGLGAYVDQPQRPCDLQLFAQLRRADRQLPGEIRDRRQAIAFVGWEIRQIRQELVRLFDPRLAGVLACPIHSIYPINRTTSFYLAFWDMSRAGARLRPSDDGSGAVAALWSHA